MRDDVYMTARDWFVLGALNPALKVFKMREGDYVVDGLVHCGRCHAPRQFRRSFPEEGMGDEVFVLPIACLCELEAAEARRREDQAARRNEYRLRAMPLPEHRKMTVEASDCPLPVVENYVNNFDDMMRDNVGLLMYGMPGCGKTYMAAAIANRLIDRGRTAYMHNLASMMPLMRDTYGGGHDAMMTHVRNAQLLVIDDFGTESTSDYSLQLLYELIETRIEVGMPMIITSNLEPRAMQAAQDVRLSRLYSRIASLHPCPVTGGDRRKKDTRDRFAEINKILGL